MYGSPRDGNCGVLSCGSGRVLACVSADVSEMMRERRPLDVKLSKVSKSQKRMARVRYAPSPPSSRNVMAGRRDTDTVIESLATYCLCGSNDGVMTSVDSREFDFDSIQSVVFSESDNNDEAAENQQQYYAAALFLKANGRDRMPKRGGNGNAYRRKLEEIKSKNINRQNVIDTYTGPLKKQVLILVVKNSWKAFLYINRMERRKPRKKRSWEWMKWWKREFWTRSRPFHLGVDIE